MPELMSFVTADLPDVTDSTRNSKLEDHTVEKLGQSSETSPCSCDMCSFTKLKEIERNIPPGLSMPYFASPFSPTNIPTGGAHLAPRTGHEQPYWHRPCYFGWQYMTNAAQVAHQASFHQPANILSTPFHFSRYNATACHDTGCHAPGCNVTAMENSVNVLGGVAYDHGEFPKIVSVHSFAERPTHATQASSVCEATDCHGNNGDDDQSNCAISGNPLTETKIGSEGVTDTRKSTDHSISTILVDLSSLSPVQNVGGVKSLAEVIKLGNNARMNELQTEWVCSSGEDENVMISNGALESPNPAEGLSNAALTENNSGSAMEGTGAHPSLHVPPLKIRKATLILHRMRKINKIQKLLKHEQSERKKARLLKKMAILKKEIELLTNAGSPHRESPLNATPVKTSQLAPNKEEMEREARMVDSRLAEGKTRDWKEEFKVDTSMGEYLSSEQPKGELHDNDFSRMNVFEKLGLLNEQDSSCELSTSSESASPHGSSDSKTSEVVKQHVEESSTRVFERKCTPRFYSEQSADSEDNQGFNESVPAILVKSAGKNFKSSLEYATPANVCNSETEHLPVSWSSAYVSENRRKLNSSSDVPKRKQYGVVLNGESAKRRCKTLPRKVVWKHVPVDKMPTRWKASKEIAAARGQNVSTETEVNCEAENDDVKPFAASLNVTSDVNGSCLSIKPDAESSASDHPEACWVYDDDTLQRKLEIRESKISDLLRKQEGLLQTIEKMATKTVPEAD